MSRFRDDGASDRGPSGRPARSGPSSPIGFLVIVFLAWLVAIGLWIAVIEAAAPPMRNALS